MGLLTAATTSSSGASVGLVIAYVVIYLLFALPVYGTLKKAGSYGEPAWAAFIPIYDVVVILKMVGRPRSYAWWLLIGLVPVIGTIVLLVLSIIVLHDVSKSFGHRGGFTVGLVLLSVIFWYILWLGSSEYRGPSALRQAEPGGYGSGGYPPPSAGYPAPPPPPPPAGAAPPPAAPAPPSAQ